MANFSGISVHGRGSNGRNRLEREGLEDDTTMESRVLGEEVKKTRNVYEEAAAMAQENRRDHQMMAAVSRC